METIPQLLSQDPERLRILKMLAGLNLKDAYIAAGFVRNMVWDYLHKKPQNKQTATPLNLSLIHISEPTRPY